MWSEHPPVTRVNTETLLLKANKFLYRDRMQYNHSVPDSQLKKNFIVNYFSKKECMFKIFKEEFQL